MQVDYFERCRDAAIVIGVTFLIKLGSPEEDIPPRKVPGPG
jgi:hypothetical protein